MGAIFQWIGDYKAVTFLSQLYHWTLHFIAYWLVPIPIFLLLEFYLRQTLFIGKQSQPSVNAITHYRINFFILKLQRIPIFGKGLFSLCYLAHNGFLYNAVIKDGQKQWQKTHNRPQPSNRKPASVRTPTAMRSSGQQKKPALNVSVTSRTMRRK